MHLREHAHMLKVVRALLGVGKALGRTVVLPRMLCYCDFMWKEMRACRVGGAESMELPFDCPMDHVSAATPDCDLGVRALPVLMLGSDRRVLPRHACALGLLP